MVRAFQGPNNKYINSVGNAISNGGVVMTSPGVFLLNGVAQGTGENGRIGRLVRNNWIDLDFLMYTQTYQNSPVFCRAYVVVETTCLGSAVAPAQFFVDPTNFSSTSQRDRSNRNASRYVVLYDSGIKVLGPPAGASGLTAPANIAAASPCAAVSMHLPLNFYTDYSRGNAGTVADIETNSLYLLVVTDTTTANQLAVSGGYTLCFNDDS